MRFKFADYEHLLRLAALFGAGVAVFLAAQAVLVPADFGRYGHYRAGALDTAMARPLVHAGEAACAACHEDVAAARAPGAHARVRCESCHGPQAAHAAGDPPPARPDSSTLCARCHEKEPARPRAFPQVDSLEHASGERCTTCHAAHAPRVP
jgi:predicted CXXCH cytochrome family protein